MKKKWLAVALAAALAAGLGACGKAEDAETAGMGQEAENNNDTAAIGDGKSTEGSTAAGETSQVVIAVSEEPETLDPCIGWGHGTSPIIQSTLLAYDSQMELHGDLATDWSVSDDGLVWSFTLRDDAFFTTGEPVTAADVAFSYETARDSRSSVDFTYLKECRVVDDTHVELELTKPNITFANAAATMGIVPKDSYDADYGIHPVGSGPYKFVEWKQGEQLILEANEDYYGGKLAIDRAVILFMGEDQAYAAAQAGQVDIALTSATLAVNEIPGMHLEQVKTVDNRGITMPMTPEGDELSESGQKVGNNVTCQKSIREALAIGIDRKMIARDALNGYATPAYSECDGYPWCNEDITVDYDLEKAKQILAEDGWADTDRDGIVEKDGLKAEFTIVYPSGDSVRQACAMAAKSQAENLGIRINVEGTSWDEISRRMFSDCVLMGWGSANPSTSYSLFHSSGKLKDDYYNPENYSNPAVDAHLEAALSSLTAEDAYREFQLAQWDGTEGTSMKGDIPWVWLVNVDHLYFVRDGLDIGEQQPHAHGSTWPLIINLKQWKWTETEENK